MCDTLQVTGTASTRGIHLRVTATQYDALLVVAGAQGTLSDVVRAAVEQYLATLRVAQPAPAIDKPGERV